MGGLSWWHWLIILGAFVLLFGAKKLPDAARGVGRSLRILKSEVSAMHDDDEAKRQAAQSAPADVTPVVPSPAPQISASVPTPPTAPPVRPATTTEGTSKA